ncbi:hypothetical protein BME96_04950 [Virgibacillus halodenitrificans]|uniref:Lipoprotein n=1 Tax=Virgibacillus halodenitrificans TaxID=1482 RepID=A0AAC9J0F0_VIRHA|nr:hypothetical protein [Virgibacillus halodenitrificans]APC47555.1 hypothetical protein BME96_04950 [Virgibacillus halodenitrificans]
MKYWPAMLVLFLAVLLGGCQEDKKQHVKPSEINVENLPDVRAFQDEFTREFLQSTEETREGYYPFLSGTGAYKMDFPAGGIVGEKGYAIEGERFESFRIGVKEKQIASSINFKYKNEKRNNVEVNLDMLKTSMNKSLQFEEFSLKDRDMYLARFENESGSYGMVGYIQNKLSTGGVSAIYTSECTESPQPCEEVNEINNKKMLNWLKSIKFVKE